MEKELIEKYWKVFRGKCNIKEAMQIFGMSKEDSEQSLEEIKHKDNFDAGAFFVSTLALASMAYEKLVEAGEIDSDIIYFSGDGPYVGDIGWKGKDIYRYMGNEWQKQ